MPLTPSKMTVGRRPHCKTEPHTLKHLPATVNSYMRTNRRAQTGPFSASPAPRTKRRKPSCGRYRHCTGTERPATSWERTLTQVTVPRPTPGLFYGAEVAAPSFADENPSERSRSLSLFHQTPTRSCAGASGRSSLKRLSPLRRTPLLGLGQRQSDALSETAVLLNGLRE